MIAIHPALSITAKPAYDIASLPAFSGGGDIQMGLSFAFIVKTNNSGTSTNEQFSVPTDASGTYSATVDWGDGNVESGLNTFNDARWTHTYAVAGNYTVMITGVFKGIRFNDGGDKLKLLNICQWGILNLGNANNYFSGCSNLIVTATDILDLTGTTDLLALFNNCSSLTNVPNIGSWDVSLVTRLNFAFATTPFNGDISGWDVGNVTTMLFTFASATSFNNNIGGWDVSSLQNSSAMFFGATSFNQDLGAWNVINLASAGVMFDSVTLSTSNYDSLLIGWNNKVVQPNVTFSGGDSQYSIGAATTARSNLISSDNWSITDGGQLAGFESNWQTDNTGVSANNQIKLPLESSGTYNFTVFWGDGNQDTITTWNQAETTHTYAVAGNYTVNIIGTINGFRFNATGDRQKILDISNWGTLLLGNSGDYFDSCSNLTITATDILDLTGTTSFANMFIGCSSLTTIPSINSWDTSNITTLMNMFSGASSFNQALSFDTSSVLTMLGMFISATSFNSSITFDTSQVTNMDSMFFFATAFNQPLSFNTASLTNTNNMLSFASSFDQDLGSWNVSNLTTAGSMFTSVTLSLANYNSLLIGWDGQILQNGVTFDGGNSQYSAGTAAAARLNMVSSDNWSITDGGQVFSFISNWQTDNAGVSANNQITIPTESSGTYAATVDWGDGNIETGLNTWDDARWTHTYSVAGNYTVIITGTITGFRFNNGGDRQKILNISEWGVLKVGNSNAYFRGCVNLTITATDNLDLTGTTTLDAFFVNCVNITAIPNMGFWNVSNVTSMISVFDGCTLFNEDLAFWTTNSVVSMSSMFGFASSFNQDISSWNTGNVADMSNMFFGATLFDQDIGSWNVTSLTNAFNMFNGVTLSVGNYDSLLIGWDAQVLQSSVLFTGGSSQYSSAAVAARANMISSDLWTITDGGQTTGFVFNVQTDNVGTSANNQFTVPTNSSGSYSATVDWGDGNIESGLNTFNDARWTHTYSSAGNYTVNITGVFTGISFNNTGDKLKLLDISQWGIMKLGNTANYFAGCTNLTVISATDILDLTGTTNLSSIFSFCSSLSFVPNVNSWNVSSVTNFAGIFRATNFNQDISSWNVALGQTFVTAFQNTPFNQDISGWTTSSLANTFLMFNNSSFNQNIGGWDVSNLTSATNMFLSGSLSTANYDALLIGWDAQVLKPNVSFNAGNAKYSVGAATTARSNMISSDNWSIVDGGQAP